eukprot:403371418
MKILLQFIEANTEASESEKELVILRIELDKFRKKYFPENYLEEILRNEIQKQQEWDIRQLRWKNIGKKLDKKDEENNQTQREEIQNYGPGGDQSNIMRINSPSNQSQGILLSNNPNILPPIYQKNNMPYQNEMVPQNYQNNMLAPIYQSGPQVVIVQNEQPEPQNQNIPENDMVDKH